MLIISLVVFLLGTVEELWKRFLPKYLEALGASVGAIGLFGAVRDLLDAVYQYPGGWLSDRIGSRRVFLVFVGLAFAGYLIYLISHSWEFVFVGLIFTAAWQSMGSPTVFAAIGNALPKENRAVGFTLQSGFKPVPMIFSPILGGMLIAKFGIEIGIHFGLVITIFLAVLTFIMARAINLPVVIGESVNIKGVWHSFHLALKRLLISDIII